MQGRPQKKGENAQNFNRDFQTDLLRLSTNFHPTGKAMLICVQVLPGMAKRFIDQATDFLSNAAVVMAA
jgi:hypothetical protein